MVFTLQRNATELKPGAFIFLQPVTLISLLTGPDFLLLFLLHVKKVLLVQAGGPGNLFFNRHQLLDASMQD